MIEIDLSSFPEGERISATTLCIFINDFSNRSLYLDFNDMNRYPVSNGEAIASNWPDNENRINYLKTHFYEGEQQYSLDENFVEDFPAINFLNSKIEIKAINFTKRVIVPIYLNNISNGSMNERNHTNENYNLSVLSYNSSTTKFTNFSLYYT